LQSQINIVSISVLCFDIQGLASLGLKLGKARSPGLCYHLKLAPLALEDLGRMMDGKRSGSNVSLWDECKVAENQRSEFLRKLFELTAGWPRLVSDVLRRWLDETKKPADVTTMMRLCGDIDPDISLVNLSDEQKQTLRDAFSCWLFGERMPIGDGVAFFRCYDLGIVGSVEDSSSISSVGSSAQQSEKCFRAVFPRPSCLKVSQLWRNTCHLEKDWKILPMSRSSL
jgi:hypothetical protein